MSFDRVETFPRVAGDFRLVRELGRGGMGIVYCAEELGSGRTVALKVLSAELSVAGEAFERFRREARIAASISDSRCVFVYGAHDVDGQPAISMELCEGNTLQEEIGKGQPIPIERAVRWALDILEGLEAAHRSDVVHRDVKPSNCFLTADGTVKVGDFGLSRTFERDVQLTQSGQFLGSPLYASPEQIKGRSVDERSDQYSAAATLYALLTGRPPYTGSNLGEVLARILSEPPDAPRSVRAEIPRGLEKVLLRAMDRDPAKRFKDLATFREALQPFVTSELASSSLLKRFGAYMFDVALLTIAVSPFVAWTDFAQMGATDFDRARPWMMQTVAAQMTLGLIPIVYYALCEGTSGATLGKWLFGMRVVSSASGEPSFGRAWARVALFELSAQLMVLGSIAVATGPMEFSAWSLAGWPLLYLLRCVSMRRSNGWRGTYEFASGTRVVRSRSPLARREHRSAPPPARLSPCEPVAALGAAYEIEGVLAHHGTQRWLLARDQELRRDVWIHEHAAATTPISDARRALASPTRLRWLARVRGDQLAFDVYEAPGGSGIVEITALGGALAWPTAARVLLALSEELEREQRNGTTHGTLEQVWIDRSWNVRWLDAPLGETRSQPRPLLEVVGEAAATALLGDRDARDRLPTDLPVHAETLVRRLLSIDKPFGSLRELAGGLRECLERQTDVSTRQRGSQLGLALALPGLAGTVAILIAAAILHYVPMMKAMVLNARELRDGERITAVVVEPATGEARPGSSSTTTGPSGGLSDEEQRVRVPLTPDGKRARQILVVESLEDPFGAAMFSAQTGEQRAVFDAALSAFPKVTAADSAWARDVLAREEPLGEASATKIGKAIEHYVWTFGVGTFVVFGALGSMLSLLLGRPLSFALFGLHLRSRKGTRASRLLACARSLAAWLPIGCVYVLAARFAQLEHAWVAWAIFLPAATAHAWVIAQTLWSPSKSPLDRVLGTSVVPR